MNAHSEAKTLIENKQIGKLKKKMGRWSQGSHLSSLQLARIQSGQTSIKKNNFIKKISVDILILKNQRDL